MTFSQPNPLLSQHVLPHQVHKLPTPLSSLLKEPLPLRIPSCYLYLSKSIDIAHTHGMVTLLGFLDSQLKGIHLLMSDSLL